MPIYEFACPKCRRIFSFLSKRVHPDRLPVCPRCGSDKLIKQLSSFAFTRGKSRLNSPKEAASGPGGPDIDHPQMARVMAEMERDMAHLDENNPKHMAHLMRKMKDLMPPGSVPKEMEAAIKRLEAGEDPEKIEADMGDLFAGMMGSEEGGPGGGGGFTRDGGLYDY